MNSILCYNIFISIIMKFNNRFFNDSIISLIILKFLFIKCFTILTLRTKYVDHILYYYDKHRGMYKKHKYQVTYF